MVSDLLGAVLRCPSEEEQAIKMARHVLDRPQAGPGSYYYTKYRKELISLVSDRDAHTCDFSVHRHSRTCRNLSRD